MPDKQKAGSVNYLLKYGVKVAENGWPIVLLPHGQKKPINNRWQNLVWRPGQIKTLVNQKKRFGIGIKCGNIVCLDNDYEEGGAVTEEFRDAILDLQKHFFPDVMLRKGRPERMPSQIFRLENGETYRSMNLDKFQILGVGRQFVAYNIHPDTDEPYRWGAPDNVLTPARTHMDDVPSYPKKTVDDFIQGLAVLIESWGIGGERAGSAALERIKDGDLKPQHELRGDRGLLTTACDYIENPPEWGWEEWTNKFMLPLWCASGGEDWGLELAHKVSEKNPSYDKDYTDKRWEEIGRSPPNRIGAGTIYWLARQGGMPFLGPEDWNDYRAFKDRLDILDAKTGTWLQRQSFNDIFVESKEKGKNPIQLFIHSRPSQLYSTVTWDPSLPYGEAVSGPRRLWNTCDLPEDYYEEGDVLPWLELMGNIYGEHVDVIEKRMAFDVQYPALKPQWHELIIGQHGAGKNLVKQPLFQWFNTKQMGKSINAINLESNFNGWMANMKYLELTEVDAVSNKTFNKHKDMFASQDEWILVNEKFMKPFYVRNALSVYMSANGMSSISISPDERRIFVARKISEMLPKKQLVYLHNWMRDNWKHVIWYLKHDVKVSSTFCDILPYRTEAMMELVRVAGIAADRMQEHVKEAVSDMKVFNFEDLHRHLLACNVDERQNTPITKETLRKTLMASRAVRCHKGEAVRLQDGERKRLWSFDHDLENAGQEELRLAHFLSGEFKHVNDE